MKPWRLRAIFGDDRVAGRHGWQLVRVEDGSPFTKESDPALDRGQELDPALLVECGEEPVDAGLVPDPECLREFGPRRWHAEALDLVADRSQGTALLVGQPDRAHRLVALA